MIGSRLAYLNTYSTDTIVAACAISVEARLIHRLDAPRRVDPTQPERPLKPIFALYIYEILVLYGRGILYE